MKRFATLALVAVALATAAVSAQEPFVVGVDRSTTNSWTSITSSFERETGITVDVLPYAQADVAQQVVFQSFTRSDKHQFFMIPNSWGASLHRYMEDLGSVTSRLRAAGVTPAEFSGRTLGVTLPFAPDWFLGVLDWPENQDAAVAFLIAAGGGASSQVPGTNANDPINAPSTGPANLTTQKIARSEHNPVIDGALGAMLAAVENALGPAAAQITSFLPSAARAAVDEIAKTFGVPFSSATSTVTVVVESRSSSTTTAQLKALGINPGQIDQGSTLVKVSVPLSDLSRLATELAGVSFLRPPYEPYVLGTPSQGSALIGADAYHAAGITGAGAKVAVIDLGFQGLTQARGRGDVPASAVGNDLTGTGLETGVSHGTAVAEVIYDIAPGAQLYLIKIGDEVDLDQAVTYCINNGIDIINHSLGWYNTNFYDGTGTIGDIARRATDSGILWINAAGNEAQSHWSGTFVDGNSDGWLDTSTTLYASSGSQIILYLTWNEWPGASTDYDLYLYDGSNNVVASSTKYQTGVEEPTESIQVSAPATGTYTVRIQGAGSRRLELFSVYQNVSPAIAGGSILAPANLSTAVAVGAVDQANYSSGPLQPYSSQGPSNSGSPKPNLVAPDNVATGTPPYTTFPGTSGAAPHVAGAAALLLEQQPSLSGASLRSLLLSQSVAMGSPNQFGNGRLALQPPTTPNQPPVASFTFNPSSPAVNVTVSFNGSASNDPDGSIVNYAWDFNNDGFTDASGPVASYAFPTTGAYSVRLTVRDDDGASDTETQTVNVSVSQNQPPSASFAASPTTAQPNDWISFDASASTDVDGSITGYAWDFGDGNAASGMTAFHRYGSPGTYAVRLTVTDNQGATDSASRSITIQQAAAADLVPTSLNASPSAPTVGQTLTFTFTVQNAGSASAASFRVRLQGATNSTQTTMSSIGPGSSRTGSLTLPLTASSETFTLTVDSQGQVPESNEGNNTRTLTVNASTPPPPVADAGGPYSADVNQSLVFDGSGSSGTISSYFWTFGDGGTGSGPSPVHTYASAGTYTATLTVSGPGGQSSDSAPVSIAAGQPTLTGQLSLPKGSYVVGESLSITYTVNRTAYVYLCQVEPDNRVVLIYPSLFERTEPVSAGTHVVPSGFYTLRTSEPTGTKTLYLFVSSTALPEFPTSFGFGFPTLSNNPGVFRDGVLATMQTLAGPGNWAFDTLSFQVEPEAPTTGTLEVSTVPSNATVRLDGTTIGTSPLQRTGVSPGLHTVQVSKSGYVTETRQVTINAGSTTTVQVTLTPQAPANQSPNASFSFTPTSPVAGEVVTFDGGGSSDPDGAIVAYEWTFGDGGTATGIAVTHSFPSNRTYTVTLTVRDDDGASDSTSRDISVRSLADVGWMSPTSFEDPANEWSLEENAYDDNIDYNDVQGTYNVMSPGETSSFLFYGAPGGGLQADGLRLFTHTGGSGTFVWDVDVERDGAWIDVFEDHIQTDWEWTQIAFDAGVVTRVRLRVTNPTGGTWRASLYELDLHDANATP